MASGVLFSPELNHDSTLACFKQKFNLPAGYPLPQDTIKVLKSISSDNPAVRPIVDESPNLSQIENWKHQFIELFPDKVRAARVAGHLLENLVKIDEFHFEQKLLKSFNEAAINLKKENTQNTAFVYDSEGKEKSTPWVIDLLKDHLPNEPMLELPLLDYSNKNLSDQANIGIIIDNASFSGTQIRDHLYWGQKKFGISRFYVIVPFITQTALDAIVNTSNGLKVSTNIFSDEVMPTLDKILGEEDFKWLNDATPFHRLTNGQTTTYFINKRPDYRSFCPYIGDTKDILPDGGHLESLVPKRPAVYHKDYFDDLRKRGKL